MPENRDTLYGVLLDVQKQIGVISTNTEEKLGKIDKETGRQSQMLIDLNDKVAVANGRTGKNEESIARLKEWRRYVLGGMAVVALIGSVAATLYIKFVATEAANNAISALEDKYNININE